MILLHMPSELVPLFKAFFAVFARIRFVIIVNPHNVNAQLVRTVTRIWAEITTVDFGWGITFSGGLFLCCCGIVCNCAGL